MEQNLPAAQMSALEKVIINGDLKELSPEQRIAYYKMFCEAQHLDPRTRPFQYLTLNGKLVLYADKGCAEQVRRRDHISIVIVAREHDADFVMVTSRATLPDGRTDESIGAVNVKGLSGDALANAMMKAETKSKRRVTLSIAGIGLPDESEIETIRDARPVVVSETGEVIEQPAKPALKTIEASAQATVTAKTRSNKATPEAVRAWSVKDGEGKFANFGAMKEHCTKLGLVDAEILDAIDGDSFKLATYTPIEAMQRATDIADRKRTTQPKVEEVAL